ncbi:NAD(P)/FAD-dependent oxidoreductase [Methylobacterium sp. 092160098-2]|uniref:NAD(P)/FAD-dependent oxidoreductase n=1 Tax=Methylobacterium sp. 092160098-2 TaxID=3025129 RepID=UPI0031586478
MTLPLTIATVVIVGGGAGGLATAASLLRRRPDLNVTVIEPRDTHYYQPGWTLVGGGIFDQAKTARAMASTLPTGAKWHQAAVAGFEPALNRLSLTDGTRIGYDALVVAPGIELNWDGIEGLRDTLGQNGVTSNYAFDLAPYTDRLVRDLRGGRALFTQPPMPIKCAGAPQKAMYLSCDRWRRAGRLEDIDVEFHSAGATLFGVEHFVPSLMRYIERYGIDLNLTSTLTAVDGEAKRARFSTKDADGTLRIVERDFKMLHVCPPQRAPGIIRESELADSAGWVEVDPGTLRHRRFGNIFGLGDACSAPNAKTAAAVRKQAPVVAENLLATLDGRAPAAIYDGYGSCPLTVERGRVVLAEFGYGGKLMPSFPAWLIDGTKPSHLAWFLKERMLPPIYWKAMLKGREWLAKPRKAEEAA